jgi:hypothetical protein
VLPHSCVRPTGGRYFPKLSRSSLHAWALLAAALATMATVSPARAGPPPSLEDQRVAHEDYEGGKAAFEAKDYLRAARLFLEAYRRAPHHDPLWNAARSFELAGERARAANLYTRYLDEAPPDARDRDRATSARKELATALGRLDVHAHDVTDVRVDGETLYGQSVYVDPGQHVIRGRSAGHDVERVQSVAAGAAASVVLEPPPPPEAPSPRPEPAPSRGVRVLPPLVVYVGAGLTVAAAAVTTWSGLDTVNTKKQYETTPTPGLLSDGLAKQDRTNVLFWTTLGLGVLTGAAALGFVDWHPQGAVRVGVGPGSAVLNGSF